MRCEGEGITTWWKCTTMNPPSGVVKILAADGIEREPFSPYTALWSFVYSLNIAREDPGMGIRRSSSKQNWVGVPSYRRDSTANGFLQVLRNPPVIFLFEITNRNYACPRTHSKLTLRRWPSHESSRTVDAKKNQRRLPSWRRWLPNIRVTVWVQSISPLHFKRGIRDRMRCNEAVHRRTLGTGDDSAWAGCNVYACDNLVVPFELIMKGKLAPRPTVKFNIIISRNSQRFSVCGERVVCNWGME